ncbi:MAG: hypothetical protein K0B81_07195 [Candidatus Cloacimonetes bacterium]|nr:hypothetical protein [Candidatus Cloacimonadota bacterium]
MEKQNIDIFDILLVLAKRKKFILITTFLVTVIFIIYSLLANQYWKSSVKFLPISRESTTMPFAQSLFGGFGAGLLGQDMVGSAENYINIIYSRGFSERIIEKFNLMDYFKIKHKDPLIEIDLAILKLHKTMLSTETDIITGMLTLTIESRDRQLSTDIANTYYEMLEEYYLTTKMSKGRERRMFLEKRINDFEENFQELTGRLEGFQRDHMVIDLQTQSEAIIALYSTTVAEKLTTGIELDFALQFMSQENPVVDSLITKLSILDQQIENLENSEPGIVPKYIINIDDLPYLSNQYLQFTLSLEIQKKVIEFLYPQYEQARLDEINDVSSFELIDEAVPAGLRSKPRRAVIVVIAFLASLLLSSLLVYTHDILMNTPRKEKVDSFLKELGKR